MSAAIGVIGEDATDVRVLEVLLRRMIPRSVGIRGRSPPVGRGGCAALRKSAMSFMKDLYARGCTGVVFVHDLDLSSANNELNDEDALRARLAKIEVPAGMDRLICIPVEELEAWFWADQGVLDWLGDGGKASSSPHTIKKPKERLKELSARRHHKAIYSTAVNEELARRLDLEVCATRCRAFAELRRFVGGLFPVDASGE